MRPTEPQSEQLADSVDERVDVHPEPDVAVIFDRGFPVFKVSEEAPPLTSEMVRRALDDD